MIRNQVQEVHQEGVVGRRWDIQHLREGLMLAERDTVAAWFLEVAGIGLFEDSIQAGCSQHMGHRLAALERHIHGG